MPLALPVDAAAETVTGGGTATAPAGWLSATGIVKRYGRHTVRAGVDLAIERGSFVVLAGRNGAGKSTLLGCLAGTIHCAGTIRLDGRPLGRATRQRVSYLPQRLRLPAASTGHEVLRLFGSLGRGESAPIELTMPAGFLPDLDQPIGQLSGGQAQRVALTAALAGRPELVLLDEPFANLDDAGREVARSALRTACDGGATVIVASPTALDLLAAAERVVLIEDGRIAFDGPPGRYAGAAEGPRPSASPVGEAGERS